MKPSERFICKHCGAEVSEKVPGSRHRNHCPKCLYSRHVDISIGDRKSKCKGMMKPVGIVARENGEELIVHQCQGCGFVSKNRVAGDDDEIVVSKLRENGIGGKLI